MVVAARNELLRGVEADGRGRTRDDGGVGLRRHERSGDTGRSGGLKTRRARADEGAIGGGRNGRGGARGGGGERDGVDEGHGGAVEVECGVGGGRDRGLRIGIYRDRGYLGDMAGDRGGSGFVGGDDAAIDPEFGFS